MDLSPQIVMLLTGQEERIMNRINEVHDDVKDTNTKITLQNGRLRKVELKVEHRDTFCESREKIIDGKMDEMEPTVRVTKVIRMVMKNPKLALGVFVGSIIGTQALVLTAVENEWLGQLIRLIR